MSDPDAERKAKAARAKALVCQLAHLMSELQLALQGESSLKLE